MYRKQESGNNMGCVVIRALNVSPIPKDAQCQTSMHSG